MKAVYDSRQRAHSPRHFTVNGKTGQSPEQPERADRLLAGARDAGCAVIAPTDYGMGPIAAVHSPEYLTFLRTIHATWRTLDGASEEVVPKIHPRSRTDGYPSDPIGQTGFHQADTSCPIGEHTWTSAYWSAQTAVHAASLVAGGDRSAYALCRPPGHHAFADQAGGFCFLNNSAIAADWLRAKGLRPAIVDVDVHHGNGTQGIFYDRDDVLTVSIHGAPDRFYPFFWGYAQERGAGRGVGYNLNLPLDKGTGDDGFLAALDTGLERVADFGADVIVVALGLDAFEGDPFKQLAITTGGFSRIGARFAAHGTPVLFVQEGGYLSDALGANLTAVLTGFETAC